jgi:hypothetical protein
MKNSQLVLSLIFIAGLSIVFLPEVSAQSVEDAFGFNDKNVEDKAAPINFLIPVALMVGAYFGVKKLKE